jgi:hypothetical protein
VTAEYDQDPNLDPHGSRLAPEIRIRIRIKTIADPQHCKKGTSCILAGENYLTFYKLEFKFLTYILALSYPHLEALSEPLSQTPRTYFRCLKTASHLVELWIPSLGLLFL